jgi:hypothetical protein
MTMSCCGRKRAEFSSGARAEVDARQYGPLLPRVLGPQPVIFEYVGTTDLAALGPVTQRLYRFDRPRARVAVDSRDAPSIAAVPKLRRVS